MKRIGMVVMALAASAAFAQQDPLSVLNRADQSASNWMSNTMYNARMRVEMDQVAQERAWYRQCMYQTNGNARYCQGMLQTGGTQQPRQQEPEGVQARLVERGSRVRTVSGGMAWECMYEVRGQRFVRLYDECPYEMYVR